MTPLTAAHIRALASPPAPPCVSVYLPTPATQPDRTEAPIRYTELVRRAEAELRQKYPAAVVQEIVRKFDAVPADAGFWAEPAAGLAVLGSADQLHVFRTPRPVPERAIVADSFHLKPLLRITQSADRFHVLGISRSEAFLFEGDRDRLAPVKGVLPVYDEAVGVGAADPDRPVGERPGHAANAPGRSGAAAGKVEIDANRERWYRAVDRAVLERLSTPTGLPVALVGLPDNTSEFRRCSHNTHLLEPDVAGDPGAFTLNELRAKVWAVVEPRYLARLHQLTEGFGTAKAHGTGSADPAAIGEALAQGRVGLLLADADRVLPGRVDPATGAVTAARLDDPDADDLIDDLAELTLRTGGQVVVVPSDRMPTDTGVAAVYRY